MSLLCLTATMFHATSTPAAPAQLQGKSIVVSWTEQRAQKPVGAAHLRSVSVALSFTVYVSTVGRVFTRVGNVLGTRDQVGSRGGPASTRHIQFQARGFTTTAMLGGGARRIVVDFGEGYGTCSARVIVAKEAGSSVIVAPHIAGKGTKIEIHSVTTGGATCSIRSGNVFAGE
jgi:hypothetical protein